MKNRLRNIYLFVRWQIKPMRYLTRYLYVLLRSWKKTVDDNAKVQKSPKYSAALVKNGYTEVNENVKIPDLSMDKFAGRSDQLPFVDVANEEWPAVKEVMMNILENTEISSAIVDYLEGNPWLWNLALNYSEPSGRISDSQLWHFDYGDIKQLHIMVYFSDVDVKSGPFTFLDAGISEKAKRKFWTIERYTDTEMRDKFEVDVNKSAIKLIAGKRTIYMADPGRVLHQGARCERPRLVLFATFTTVSPMSLGGARTLRQNQRLDLFETYQKTSKQGVFNKGFFM